MKKVTMYVMRHGEKEDGEALGISNDLTALTPTGVQQVQSSARHNLMSVQFDGLFCSLKYRALQTVVSAVGVLPCRNNGLGVNTREGFDYSSAPNLDKFSEYSLMVKERAGVEKMITVATWMEIASEMIGHLRKKIVKAIVSAACDIVAGNDTQDEYNILVGSHSPTSELAALNPETMPVLRETDIIQYTVNIYPLLDGWNGEIIKSVYIPRGF